MTFLIVKETAIFIFCILKMLDKQKYTYQYRWSRADKETQINAEGPLPCPDGPFGRRRRRRCVCNATYNFILGGSHVPMRADGPLMPMLWEEVCL